MRIIYIYMYIYVFIFIFILILLRRHPWRRSGASRGGAGLSGTSMLDRWTNLQTTLTPNPEKFCKYNCDETRRNIILNVLSKCFQFPVPVVWKSFISRSRNIGCFTRDVQYVLVFHCSAPIGTANLRTSTKILDFGGLNISC